ncbi:MAG: DUF4474 domain-containing protein [Ruminococcus sp.]|nr:DUF4474 domain-containing protein [Ruminococcus sp.]
MDKEKFLFNDGNNEYVLWIWRGDYLNLGAGAEMGIYQKYNENDTDMPSLFSPALSWLSDNGHWFSVDFELPMTLSLYKHSLINIQSVFNWAPENSQWWITGFNLEYMNPSVDRLFMVGSVDFSNVTEKLDCAKMYSSLKTYVYQNNLDKHFIFDDTNRIVWVYWGGIE